METTTFDDLFSDPPAAIAAGATTVSAASPVCTVTTPPPAPVAPVESPVSSVPQRPPVPRAPASVTETGLTSDQLGQLFLKVLYTGEATGTAVAERMRVPYALLEPIVESMRVERLIEVRGTLGSGSAGYRYALTDQGRDRARQYLDANQYVGPAPVPLDSYIRHMRAMAAARGYIDRDRLRAGFAHLVVDDQIFDQLGPAVNAGKAVFLHGAPGNGKTVIAQGMGRALGGDIYVPYAIDVAGETITVFDPVVHEPTPDDEETPGSVLKAVPRDRRWIRIRRPVVIVGGELTLEMLDLTFNPISRYHEAPLQLKANGGVLLVDDFGRQRMRPEDLLNRWIVPLESRVDYLTLHNGKKIEIPFDVLTAFATNLDPLSLADEAFLRRIPYKIEVTDPSIELYSKIFEMNCRNRRLPFHAVMVAYLQRRHYAPNNRPLRACHPRDLLDQVAALCRYRGHEPKITRELLDAACQSYFVDADAAVAPRPEPRPRKRMEVH